MYSISYVEWWSLQNVRYFRWHFAVFGVLGEYANIGHQLLTTRKVNFSTTLKRKSHLCIPRKGIVRPQSQFSHSCVCEQFIQYIPRIGPHIFLQHDSRPILGIYKSLTDTWMWKLGLTPRNSFSGNICLEFSVFCLCSGITMSFYIWTLATLQKTPLCLLSLVFFCRKLLKPFDFFNFYIVFFDIVLFASLA